MLFLRWILMNIHEKYDEYQKYIGFLKSDVCEQKYFKKIREIIHQRQLVSFMNDSKWIKLLHEVEQLKFEPAFIAKRLTEKTDIEYEQNFCNKIPYYLGNWQPFYKEAMPIFLDIEYVLVQPRLTKYQGRLVNDLIIDISEQFNAVLIELNIPYVMEQQCFKIMAYQAA